MPELFSENPFIVYRSSAGSGKTYTLAREYLRLALRNERKGAYKRILAVTFTNKAMQEMKDRIIRYLDEFARGEKNEMSEELQKELRLSPKDFRGRCKKVLSSILHGYGNFAVITIDAFFQQVLRSFARELQVGGNYHLELDQGLVYEKVVDALMADLDNTPTTERWVTDFGMSKLDEGKGWEVDRQLVEYLKEIDTETFRKFDRRLWDVEEADVRRLIGDVNEGVSKFESTLKKHARIAKELLAERGLTGNEFKSGINSFISASLNKEPTKEPGARAEKAYRDDDWYAKASKQKELLDAVLDAGVRDCLSQQMQLWEKHGQEYLTFKAIQKNIYPFALAHALIRALEKYKKEHDMMFVSDATVLLKALVADLDAPFVYEKIGGFFENFLIDEFQDTSRFQWDSFRPLIENSLAEGNRNLLVGDVKQSIYRWRGGEYELLHAEVPREFAGFTSLRELSHNFRSAARIVEFNNYVFSHLPAILDTTSSVGEFSFTEVYRDATQQLPDFRKPGEGYVELVELNGENVKEQALENTVEVLKRLQDRNVPLREIAILVRSNVEAREVADFLLKYRSEHADSKYSFEIVSGESLHLSASASVNCLVAALQFVENPKDPLALAAVKRFLHQLKTGGSTLGNVLINEEKGPWDSLEESAEMLQRLPLFSLIESLIRLLGFSSFDGEIPYLLTFQDHVLSYARSGAGDITGFLDKWEEKLNKESIKISDDLDAIRIYTIHKVKGLEFHSVIMPFLDWKFRSSNAKEWFPYTHEDREFVLQIGLSSTLEKTTFAEEYLREDGRIMLDNLNMLYVAFTRASHDLWGFYRNRKDRISDWIVKLLAKGDLNSETEGVFTYGESDFIYAGEAVSREAPLQLAAYPTSDWQSKLTLKPAPRIARDPKDHSHITTGIVIHDILSSIKYLDDLPRAIERGKQTSGMDSERFSSLVEKTRLALEIPRIRDWFDTRWEVKNEWTLFSGGEEFRPDRVVIRPDQVVVIDYKTGAKKSADIRQMKTYIDHLKEVYAQNVSGCLLYLEDLEIVDVT